MRSLSRLGRLSNGRRFRLGLDGELTHRSGELVNSMSGTPFRRGPLQNESRLDRIDWNSLPRGNLPSLAMNIASGSHLASIDFKSQNMQTSSHSPPKAKKKSSNRRSGVSIESFERFNEDLAGPDYNKDDQQKKTNLGNMMDQLKVAVPKILQESLPAELLLANVLLRICPSHFDGMNSYLPNIKGHVSYYATCKALRLFLTSLVLNPNTQLHIHLIRTSRFPEPNCVYGHSTKVYIRWTTCPEGCWHLSGSPKLVAERDTYSGSSTANATLGSHRWSSIDAGKLLDKLDLNWSLTGALANLGKGIVGLRKEEQLLERIISGIFIFELNEANDEILVHTIEDMDVVERPEEERELGVC